MKPHAALKAPDKLYDIQLHLTRTREESATTDSIQVRAQSEDQAIERATKIFLKQEAQNQDLIEDLSWATGDANEWEIIPDFCWIREEDE